jgi:hypothetical protein
MKISKSDREKAVVRLREILQPGDTVHTVLRHVSRSGMSRRIDVYKLAGDTSVYLTASVADLLGYRCKTWDDGLTVGGCGMDMGFAVVYGLSCALWPDGFECIGERCPHSDHANGDRDYTPHSHKSAGYALRQQWL